MYIYFNDNNPGQQDEYYTRHGKQRNRQNWRIPEH